MSKINIGLYHFATYRQGDAQWYNGRPRGMVAVWHDGKMYLYKGLSRKNIKGIRAGIRTAWVEELSEGARLTGSFPSYSIE